MTKQRRRLKEYGAKLQSAQREAVAVIEEARRDAERLREELRERARTEADTIIKNAERQVQLETSRALQQIRKEAVDLSVTIASKILQRNISKDDNEKLIADAIVSCQHDPTDRQSEQRAKSFPLKHPRTWSPQALVTEKLLFDPN